MKNKEAIRRIKDHMRVHHIGEYPHIYIAEALNMAIAALEENEELNNEKNKYKDRYEILYEKIWRGHFGDLEDMIDEWDKEDEESN